MNDSRNVLLCGRKVFLLLALTYIVTCTIWGRDEDSPSYVRNLSYNGQKRNIKCSQSAPTNASKSNVGRATLDILSLVFRSRVIVGYLLLIPEGLLSIAKGLCLLSLLGVRRVWIV